MQDTERIAPDDDTEGAPAPGETAAPPSADPTTPPAESPPPSAPAEQEGAADPETSATGLWECLNESRYCELAAPDPRTPAKPFEGPTQDVARGEGITVACPSCKSEKVIYRGEKTDAAVAA